MKNWEAAGLLTVYNVVLPGSSRGRKLIDREKLDALIESYIGNVTTATICGHVARFNLPTRPSKGDRRGESIEHAVEIDAMRPADLREILSHEIDSYIDEWTLTKMRQVEAAERESLESINI